MNKIRLFYLISSVLVFGIGVCVYILFRDNNHLLIIKRIPLLEFTNNVYVELKPSFLSNVLRYNIPDMFWFVSGILLLRFIWFLENKEQKIYLFCFYLTGAVFEVSQLLKIIPGTFDFLDLLFMGIGALVEILLYNNYIKRRMR